MKYKHALFLNPYVERSATSIMGLFPPTGLEYVATSAEGLVDKITLLDLRHDKKLAKTENLMAFIKEQIDIIFVGICWDRQFEEIQELLKLMPEGYPLVVGGYKATEQVEELFSTCPQIDIIIRGEGEETIQEFLRGKPLENILGLSYRSNGKIIHNTNRPLPDVNKLKNPNRALRRNSYYLKIQGVNVTSMTFDAILTARGCPFNCKFCTFSLNPLGQKRYYSARTVDSVIKEIEDIEANIILFSDDNFFTDVKRAEALCDAIIEKKIKKRFIAQARIELSKYPRLLEKMVKSGFKLLLVGIESPHDWILKQLDKGFTQETVRKSFAVLKKYPIFYHGYFIYGNIGETEEEMVYIAQFAKEISVDSITYQKLRIEKFSPLKEVALKTPGYHVTHRGELYSDTYSHAKLKKIGKRIKFTYYTPWEVLRIANKFISVGFFAPKELMTLLIASPKLFVAIIKREIEKNRLGDSLKRLFIKNK